VRSRSREGAAGARDATSLNQNKLGNRVLQFSHCKLNRPEGGSGLRGRRMEVQ
jgi:hypothetical protein